MNPEEVGQILDEVTQRLAPASEAAWNLMVTEARIASMFALIAAAIILVTIIVGNVLAFRIDARSDNRGRYSDDIPAKVLSIAATVFIGLPAFFALAYNGAIGLIIPEYHLINKFLNILSGNQ